MLAVFIDLLEVFSPTDHNILINKLNLYSIKTIVSIELADPIKTFNLDIICICDLHQRSLLRSLLFT